MTLLFFPFFFIVFCQETTGVVVFRSGQQRVIKPCSLLFLSIEAIPNTLWITDYLSFPIPRCSCPKQKRRRSKEAAGTAPGHVLLLHRFASLDRLSLPSPPPVDHHNQTFPRTPPLIQFPLTLWMSMTKKKLPTKGMPESAAAPPSYDRPATTELPSIDRCFDPLLQTTQAPRVHSFFPLPTFRCFSRSIENKGTKKKKKNHDPLFI